MKLTDLKVAMFGPNPVVRIETDEDIYGYGEIVKRKEYLKPHILFYKDYILGEDPTNVEKAMSRIRRVGGNKPWGAAVSAIEMACWDVAGKAEGLPVHKLLGGKVRVKVLTYNGSRRIPMHSYRPEDYAKNMAQMKTLPGNFSIIKQGMGCHSAQSRQPGHHYGTVPEHRVWQVTSGALTEWVLDCTVDCIKAMKDVCGREVGLAMDCGPGFMPSDACKLACAVEPLNVMWLEDLITGDGLFGHAALLEVAEEAGKSPAQTALRWALQMPGIASVIAGARNAAQCKDSCGASGRRLSGDQIRRLCDAGEVPLAYPMSKEIDADKRRDRAIYMPSLWATAPPCTCPPGHI